MEDSKPVKTVEIFIKDLDEGYFLLKKLKYRIQRSVSVISL